MFGIFTFIDCLSNSISHFHSSCPYNAASAGIFERDLVETCGTTFGFRALAVSEDGKYLAAGDCGGNLHIYDLQESEYTCFTVILVTIVQFVISYVSSVVGVQTFNSYASY